MGVNISSLVKAREIKLRDLSGKVIGIDGHNIIYQFLARIRKRDTGESLVDSEGRITSHLSGIFYRTSNFIQMGIKPVFVWDGKPPTFKELTIRKRRAIREKAQKQWIKALKRGEEAMKFAQAATRVTPELISESVELLDYMGIPSIQASSEGEAQLAVMTKRGEIWAGASQDWDSLLFGTSRLIRNLSIKGQRKLPKKNEYIEIMPEMIELSEVLSSLEITHEQLIIIGILVGTDYNPSIKGVGVKTALRLVKKYKTLERILESVKWETFVDVEKIFNFFLEPPVNKTYAIQWKEPDNEKIVELLVETHNFSRIRVEKTAKLLTDGFKKQKVKPLEDFFSNQE